jgi:hypothetical protein
MNSSHLRVRWAIVLAVLQGAIFAAFGLIEHQQYLLHRKYDKQPESFGCLTLPHERLSEEDRMFNAEGDCWEHPSIYFVKVTNLPVFVVSVGVLGLTANTNVDQSKLFYIINGFGIPVFWFYIGSLIDRRRLRKAAAVSESPRNEIKSR